MSAVLDIYEYDLGDYPKNTSLNIDNHLVIDNIVDVEDNHCGKILTFTENKYNKYLNDNLRDRSCDLFDSTIIEKNINENRNIYVELLPDKFKFDILFGGITIYSQKIYEFVQKNGAKITIFNNNKTQQGFSNIDMNPLREIYSEDFFNKLCSSLTLSLKNDTILTISKNRTYIKVLYPQIYEKFILMGDFHGSLHTLFRNIIRFRALNIINQNFQIIGNYKIIFLGDIFDRGLYSYECFVLISLLKIINPENIFINRGNHEEFYTSKAYGFSNELQNKFGSIGEMFHMKILDILSLSHSAVMIKDPIFNKYIWLCHGGIPIEIKPNSSDYSIINEVTNISMNNGGDTLIIDNSPMSPVSGQNFEHGLQIRWNDFITNNTTSFNTTRKTCYYLGLDIIREMQNNNIYFVIRGHQDDKYNTKIFNLTRESLNLNPDPKTKTPKYIKNLDDPNEKSNICEDYIDSFYFVNNELKSNKMQDITDDLLPVVVLSTNTDFGKDLDRDSFAILQFLDQEISNFRMANCIIDSEHLDNDNDPFINTNNKQSEKINYIHEPFSSNEPYIDINEYKFLKYYAKNNSP